MHAPIMISVVNEPCSKCTPSIGAISWRSTPTIRTSADADVDAVAVDDDNEGLSALVVDGGLVTTDVVGSIPGAL
jgi:hypothetical protein